MRDERRLRFGDRVVPSRLAFLKGVFEVTDSADIEGIVVWGEGMRLRVHQKGRRTSSDYHREFWTLKRKS